MTFESMITRLEQAIPHSDKINLKVSQRGVDWHLEHSIKIINSICKAMADSKPADYTPKFSIIKYYILWTNKMPRGKGRSPKPFNNLENIDVSKLSSLLEEAKLSLAAIDGLKPKQHFPHPLFGDLKLSEAKKFLLIHTVHHLKIIDDIVKS